MGSADRNSEIRLVTVQEVNTTTSKVIVQDTYGQLLTLSWYLHPPLVAVPQAGEVWTVTRSGNEWFLDQKQDREDVQSALTDLQPGDRRIDTRGRVLINASEVLINGQVPLTSAPSLDGLIKAPLKGVLNDVLYYNGTTWATMQFTSTNLSDSALLARLASPTFTGTPLAPTAAVDTSTTQIATTAFVIGQASATNPAMDGTQTVGTSTRFARGDHIHPTDSSRAPTASPTFTGVPLAPTAAVDTNTTQLATTAFVIAQASSGAPVMNGAQTAGTSLRYSRADHVHPTDASLAPLASPSFTGTVTMAGNLTLSANNPSITSGSSYTTFPNGLYVSLNKASYFEGVLNARNTLNNDNGNLTLSASGGTQIAVSTTLNAGSNTILAGTIQMTDGTTSMIVHRHPYGNARHIESGTITGTFANGTAPATITFTNAFSSAPQLATCILGVNASTALIWPNNNSTSTTGGTVNSGSASGGGSGGSVVYSWIAEGAD